MIFIVEKPRGGVKNSSIYVPVFQPFFVLQNKIYKKYYAPFHSYFICLLLAFFSSWLTVVYLKLR
jgi:hypothetical protein